MSRDDEDQHWAQICVRGHVITSTTRYGTSQAFCPSCGSRTILTCEICSAQIPGASPMWLGELTPPAHCGSCGRAFPWTVTALANAEEMIDLLDVLSEDDRGALKRTLPDLMSDTPATEVAAVKFKLLARRAGGEVATALRTIVTSVATEGARRAILGP